MRGGGRCCQCDALRAGTTQHCLFSGSMTAGTASEDGRLAASKRQAAVVLLPPCSVWQRWLAVGARTEECAAVQCGRAARAQAAAARASTTTAAAPKWLLFAVCCGGLAASQSDDTPPHTSSLARTPIIPATMAPGAPEGAGGNGHQPRTHQPLPRTACSTSGAWAAVQEYALLGSTSSTTRQCVRGTTVDEERRGGRRGYARPTHHCA